MLLIIIGLSATTTLAFNYDNSLVNLWNSRKDLQKAFPGNPETNTKLEAWAKKYGWKETTDLYYYYPDKAIVERIVDNKTNDRIFELEQQVANLTAQLSQTQSNKINQVFQPTINKSEVISGKWRDCWLANGIVHCTTDDSDWPSFNNGRFKILFYTK